MESNQMPGPRRSQAPRRRVAAGAPTATPPTVSVAAASVSSSRMLRPLSSCNVNLICENFNSKRKRLDADEAGGHVGKNTSASPGTALAPHPSTAFLHHTLASTPPKRHGGYVLPGRAIGRFTSRQYSEVPLSFRLGYTYCPKHRLPEERARATRYTQCHPAVLNCTTEVVPPR